MNKALRTKEYSCDFCVIGGGLAGAFAALSAARHGAKVVLMQDRPVLGGNASSEIRMCVRGAKGKFDRESGLLSEMEERNIHHNPTLVHSLRDAVLYDMLRENENIEMLLNTSCMDVEMEGNKIRSVTGWQLTTYTFVTVRADYFADCSGDSILAPMTGAEFRKGRESKAEFGESLAQEEADEKTMGMSLLVCAAETDQPVPFTPPAFANCYPTDECFSSSIGENANTLKRGHRIATTGDNLWWVELGGDGDSIHDTDKLQHELLSCIYGVWDHIKNQDDHGMENWELEWVGALPGKRESRRYMGDHILTEHEVVSGGHFEDEVAYGGWPLDDHNPMGMRQNSEYNAPSLMIHLKEAYGIPLRSLYSRNIENLYFAGRNISATHAALSSTRVMATCALLGQAAGTAASLAVKYGCTPHEVWEKHTGEVQKTLMEDGAFLPHIRRCSSEMAHAAQMNVTEEERLRLLQGFERPRQEGEICGIVQKPGESLCLSWEKEQEIGVLRLKFDPDFSRLSISPNEYMRRFAQKIHTGKDFVPVKTANTIVKAFAVYADGREIYRTENNFYSLVKIPLNIRAKELRVEWQATHGAEEVHLYSVDLI